MTGTIAFLACLAISVPFMAAHEPVAVTSALLQCSSEDSTLVVQYNPDLDACPKDGKRCCPCNNETVLFADDFENGLQTTKWPMSYNGRVVVDPTNSSNRALGFSDCKGAGDTFSVPLSTNTEYYRVDLDYYMPAAARVERDDSGYMGFSAGLPGDHTWVLTAFQPYAQSMGVLGSTDGRWKHYSFLYRVQLPGYNWIRNARQLRVMLEETGRTGSTCGYALFDNVVVREAKVCTKSVLFYDDFESGSIDGQLWPRIKSAYVGTDDGRKVLKFAKCSAGGDGFSANFSCPTGNYRITFDYKQTVAPEPPFNDGGFVGLATGFPGHHQWFFGSNPNYPGVQHNLGGRSVWRRYSRIIKAYGYTHGVRLLVENFGTKNCDAAFFDNILVECVAFGCDCL